MGGLWRFPLNVWTKMVVRSKWEVRERTRTKFGIGVRDRITGGIVLSQLSRPLQPSSRMISSKSTNLEKAFQENSLILDLAEFRFSNGIVAHYIVLFKIILFYLTSAFYRFYSRTCLFPICVSYLCIAVINCIGIQ